MTLGLVSLLAALQTANPNQTSPFAPFDSSKTVAEGIASDLRENGQREILLGPGNNYASCWVKRETAKEDNRILEYRLCRASYLHPEQQKMRITWFLEFSFIKPDSMTTFVDDYDITGHAQACGTITNGAETIKTYSLKECETLYNSLLFLIGTPLKKEGNTLRNF